MLAFVLTILLSGCETLGYYSHVTAGQISLLWGRQDVDDLLDSVDIDADLKKQLQTAQAIRQFSVDVIGLPANTSYSSYRDVGRKAVVWNVFAAKPLSVTPKQWCFPVAGCVSYRGYFNHSLALAYAAQLERQGYETYVAEVPAYSTLGWFDDPLLNTFIYWQDWRLAALIFHEVAHQQLYIASDTAFSESFASVVEIEAVKQWLFQQGREPLAAAYLRHIAMRKDFAQGLLRLREQLHTLYQRSLNEHNKRVKKQQLLEMYQQSTYLKFKKTWNTDRYDQWVSQELNNAKLVTVSSYYQWQPYFDGLFQQAQGDWPLFFRRSKALAELPPKQRDKRLRQLQ
ncbi:MAG: putative aminopeptidase [Pseudohongiellaceae bacterium]|jgi:predicted aminopeptidase